MQPPSVRINRSLASKLGHQTTENTIMDFKQIRIENRDCGYCVAVDDTAAVCLGPEEALGIIASVLFGRAAIFTRTKEEKRAFLLRFSGEADNEIWAEFLEFLGLPFETLEKTDEELSDGK